MKSPTNETIYALLEKLSKDVDKGFKGVHERQDTTNGKVLSNTDFRLKATGMIKLIGYIGLPSVILAIVIKIYG